MIDLEVAIPSYYRPYKLKTSTLVLLEGIPIKHIKIYVENDEQYNIYRACLGENYTIIITNTKGIGEKRNFIKKHTKAKYLLQIDDDIVAIKNKLGEALSGKEVYDLILMGFKECEEHGFRLWGICGFSNYFFFNNTITTNLKFICGNFHGTIMDDNPIFTPINTLEDYYNTCSHFLEDGGVLRLNGYGTKTNFAVEKGGLQSFLTKQQRKDEESENAKIILDTFGNKMVKIIKKERGDDIRLNYRFKLL